MPTRFLILLALLAGLVWTVPAQAAPLVAVKGAPGAGPAKYDKVFVQKFGPRKAKRVLVLVPGFGGGVGDFRLVAQDIVKRVPGLQVWALDRRTAVFEDTSGFAGGDPKKAEDYYLGFKYKSVKGTSVPFVGKWGLELALEDLRRVVLSARAGGKRKVILGGHSLGASTTVAYASWDFNGRPGYKDVESLVLIDGGLRGSFSGATLARARKEMAEYADGKVFDDIIGFGIPEASGFFAEVAALYARKQPDAASALQRNPILPSAFKPPFTATNEAALGYVFDKQTSPKGLELIRINAGSVAPSGDPRPWRDGELTPIQRFADAFGSEPNAVEWYFPRRLRLDVDAMSPLRRTPLTKFLGLRPFHATKVDVPLYAYETDLTDGRVIKGAKSFVRSSRIKRATYVSEPAASHLDPLVAAPGRSRFLKTVVTFLEKRR